MPTTIIFLTICTPRYYTTIKQNTITDSEHRSTIFNKPLHTNIVVTVEHELDVGTMRTTAQFIITSN